MASQAPMGISFSNMSKTAMAGMAFGLGSFFSYLIAMAILQFFCGIIALILGCIGAVIGFMILKTERQRAIVILIFSLLGVILVVVTIAAWTALIGPPI
jgi:hypothetical protein